MRNNSRPWRRPSPNSTRDVQVVKGPSVAARLISNSRWNLIAFAIAVLANFVTLPIVISLIGLDAFGAAGLVIAIYAPFTLVGTVVGQALVMELAPRLALGDVESCNRFLSSVLAIGALGSVLVVVLVCLGGSPILHRTINAQTNWGAALLVCGLGWTAQQACLALQATMAAAQRFGRLATAASFGSVLSAGAVVIASQAMPTALGFLIGTSVGFGISLLVLASMAWSGLGRQFKFQRWHAEDLSALLHFGKWQGMAHFAGAVGNQIDRYALAAMAPLQVVGQYNVAMRLQEVVHMGVLKVSEVLFPHFSVTAKDPLDTQVHFFLRANWLCNVVAVALLAPLIPLAHGLISLWINPATAQTAAPILRTLATAAVLGAGGSVYTYYTMANGRSARLAAINALHAALLVTFTVVLIWTFGPLAAGLGYVVANLSKLAVFTRFCRRDFSPRLSALELVLYLSPPLLSGLALAWLLWATLQNSASNWVNLALSYLLTSTAVGVTALLATSLSRQGRDLIRETWSGVRQLLQSRNLD